MNNDRNFWEEYDSNALVRSFEYKLQNRESFFFDVDDFALIIDYYIETTSIEMAQTALKHALELHPETVVFKVKKAQLLAITNQSEQALSMLASVEHIEPFNADIIRAKANIYSHLQKFKDAIREYQKLSIEDDAEDIFSNIAYEYENMHRFEEAIFYLKKVMSINPLNDNALYEIAYCYEALGNIKESADFFKAYLEENPLSSIAWFNLGVSSSRLDRYEEAIEAFDFAIALEPDYPSAYFNKASVLCNQGKFMEAIESYNETLNLESPEALTFQYIGECYEKQDENDKAIQYYFKAIEINENLSEAWAGLASAYYETSNYDKALNFIYKAIKLNDQNADFAILQGDICKALEDYAQAARAYEKAIELNSEDVEVWMDLAEVIALRDENIESGIHILREALSIFPDNASLLYRLSFYLITDEKTKEGFSLLQDALYLNFNKYTEFIEMDESLLNNPSIIEIIEQAKQIKHNS